MNIFSRYPFYTKIVLIILALALSFFFIGYTTLLVSQLENRQTQVATIYAAALERLADTQNDGSEDITFIFEQLVQSIDFPVIITDATDTPIPGFYRNIHIPDQWNNDKQSEYLSKLISDFGSGQSPILVQQDSVILQKIYYSDSSLIQQLRWFPYLQIGLVSLYILIGYIAFSVIRKQEQSYLWVGMSKETAHQLGTPLSGILAWIELIEQDPLSPGQQSNLTEMKADVRRLQTVTDRFSKIGSKPKLDLVDLGVQLQSTIDYLSKRYLAGRSSIAITVQCPEKIGVKLNTILFDWVIENLIKNAFDSLSEKAEGSINIVVEKDNQKVLIDVIDNGKGMSAKMTKDIFRPGVTSKPRGWGMGLSLAKRIIEDYHKGKIYLVRSVEGEGSVFRIELIAT